MACCYHEDCGEYAVTPALVAPSCRRNEKCCDGACYPCLPKCTKSPTPKTPPRTPVDDYCPHYHYRESSPQPRRPRSPPPTRQSSATGSHCATCCHPTCKPVKTKYVIPCYRYEDGRIVSKLPVTAFKRNGMQDQEHSRLLGTTNFLVRSPRDVSIECNVCTVPVKVKDPAKVPRCSSSSLLGCALLRKKPIEVSLEDILDD